MNHTLSTAVTTPQRVRPTTPLRRAIALERKHHQALVGFYGLLAVAVIQLSVFADFHLGFVLILLAARVPADLVTHRHDDELLLRASYGISRADAVRARFWMVLWCQAPLVLGAAWSILARDYGADDSHWSTFSYSPGPSTPALRDHLVDIGLWFAAICWVHALLGGEADRPGRGPAGARAVALFLGVCIIQWMLLVGMWALTRLPIEQDTGADDFFPRMIDAGIAAQWITMALALGGAILVLLWRRRRWIRTA